MWRQASTVTATASHWGCGSPRGVGGWGSARRAAHSPTRGQREGWHARAVRSRKDLGLRAARHTRVTPAPGCPTAPETPGLCGHLPLQLPGHGASVAVPHGRDRGQHVCAQAQRARPQRGARAGRPRAAGRPAKVRSALRSEGLCDMAAGGGVASAVRLPALAAAGHARLARAHAARNHRTLRPCPFAPPGACSTWCTARTTWSTPSWTTRTSKRCLLWAATPRGATSTRAPLPPASVCRCAQQAGVRCPCGHVCSLLAGHKGSHPPHSWAKVGATTRQLVTRNACLLAPPL